MRQLGLDDQQLEGTATADPTGWSRGTAVAPDRPSAQARFETIDLEYDRRLVERFQAGDDTAFAELYSRHYARLYRTCLRCVGDPATAEDAAQEAFARAFRALPTLGGERRFYPWLSVIAKRLCIDVHRQRARSHPVESPEPGASEDGQQALMASVDVDVVRHGLAHLKSRHREILVLREFEGWSYRRIAAHYGLSVAAVETLIWRARRALQRQVTLSGYDRRAVIGLPVVGWMYRRVGSVRNRLEQWGASGLAPALGGAASVVSLGLVLGTFGSGGHPRPPVPVPAVAGRPAAPTAPAAPAALPPSGSADRSPLPGVSVPPVPKVAVPSAPPTTVPTVRQAVLGASFTNASSASQAAGQAPLHAGAAGATAGVDPKAVASDLLQQTSSSLSKVKGRIP